MIRRYFLTVVLFVLSFPAFSQTRKEWLEYGDAAFAKEDYISAAYYYQKVIDPHTSNSKEYTFPYDIKGYTPPPDTTKKDSLQQNKPDSLNVPINGKNMTPEIRLVYVTHQIAESYRRGRDYAKAEEWYAKAAMNVNNQFPEDGYYYGYCLMMNEKYPDALKQFEQITKDSTKLNTPVYKKALKGVLSVSYATDTASIHLKQTVKLLDSTVNTGLSSFAPNFYGDQVEMVFAGARKDGTVLNPKEDNPSYRTDLYTIMKKGEGWEQAKNLGAPVNSELNEGAGCISSNMDLFFFTRWDPVNPKECSIWVSKYLNGKWLQPMKMNETVNIDGYKSMQPNLSFDGTKLFFSSDRPGGKGKMDIWYADIDEYGNATKVYNLGPKINTPENEVAPYFHFKTQTLYFSSDGLVGFGGLDIFKSYPNDEDEETEVDTVWSNPINLKKPLNSSKDDEYFVLQNDQRMGYFSSDREECKDCGTTGAYCMKIYEVDKEPLVFSLSGYVYDRDSNLPIANSLLTFKDISGDLEPFYISTDDKGFYSTPLRSDLELYIKAQKKKYFGDAASVSTKGQTESKEFKQDFFLSLIPAGEIVIPGIEYDFDKATLRPESKKILDDLANFLTLNNQVYIKINSHTDSRGNDDYNMILSEARAKSCVDYLVDKGISKERLLSQGYGETTPLVIVDSKGDSIKLTEKYINSLKTDSLREAAHQRNRRTAFEVIKEDELKHPKKKQPGGDH